MTKEKSIPTNTKSAEKSRSQKRQNKTTKEETQSVPSSDEHLTNDNGAKSDQSNTPNAKKETYSRGESQKPVTDEYRKNWNSIFDKR